MLDKLYKCAHNDSNISNVFTREKNEFLSSFLLHVTRLINAVRSDPYWKGGNIRMRNSQKVQNTFALHRTCTQAQWRLLHMLLQHQAVSHTAAICTEQMAKDECV